MKINHTFLLMMALLGCVLNREFTQCKRSENLMVNGDFENNPCKQNWCLWKKSFNVSDTILPGWIIQP